MGFLDQSTNNIIQCSYHIITPSHIVYSPLHTSPLSFLHFPYLFMPVCQESFNFAKALDHLQEVTGVDEDTWVELGRAIQFIKDTLGISEKRDRFIKTPAVFAFCLPPLTLVFP